MFNISSDNKITITAGDTGYINVIIPGYELTSGDTLYLTVSNEEANDFIPVEGDLFKLRVTSFEPDGSGVLKIEPMHTKSAYGRHYYDVQVTRANGDVHTVVPRSVFEIKEGVTND